MSLFNDKTIPPTLFRKQCDNQSHLLLPSLDDEDQGKLMPHGYDQPFNKSNEVHDGEQEMGGIQIVGSLIMSESESTGNNTDGPESNQLSSVYIQQTDCNLYDDKTDYVCIMSR